MSQNLCSSTDRAAHTQHCLAREGGCGFESRHKYKPIGTCESICLGAHENLASPAKTWYNQNKNSLAKCVNTMQGLTQQTLVRSVRAVPQCTPKEIWKPIPGFEGLYEASTYGRIRSPERKSPYSKSECGYRIFKAHIMKQTDTHEGRMVVNLRRGYKSNVMKVHRVIMLTFVGERPAGTEICHNDGNYRNNRLENLRYDTSSSNSFDMVEHGVHFWAKRDACCRGHKFSGKNLIIITDEDGLFKQRGCRACNRTRSYTRSHPELKPHFLELSNKYFDQIMKEAA